MASAARASAATHRRKPWLGSCAIGHRAEALPAVAAQLVQAPVVAGAGVRVGRDGLVVGQRIFGECRPGHRRRRMRGGDDARILVGEQFGLGLAVGGQQDRIRSQEITHRRHGSYSAKSGSARQSHHPGDAVAKLALMPNATRARAQATRPTSGPRPRRGPRPTVGAQRSRNRDRGDHQTPTGADPGGESGTDGEPRTSLHRARLRRERDRGHRHRPGRRPPRSSQRRPAPNTPGGTAVHAAARHPKAAVPQSIPPRGGAKSAASRNRNWGWVLAIVVIVLALAAIAIFGTVLLTQSKHAKASQEEQVRQTIQSFDVAVQRGDLTALRGITCGTTRDGYVEYDETRVGGDLPTGLGGQAISGVASIDQVVVNGQHAEANVTTFMAYDPQTRSTRSLDLQFRDDQWKICQSPGS